MKFPIWLIPIIASTIIIAFTNNNKDKKEGTDIKKRNIILLIIGLLGLLTALGLLILV